MIIQILLILSVKNNVNYNTFGFLLRIVLFNFNFLSVKIYVKYSLIFR